MNLVLLFQNDFINSSAVILTGRRAEHIISVHRAAPDKELVVGLFNGKIGRGVVTEIDPASGKVRMEVSFSHMPPEKIPLRLILALPRPKTLKKALHAAVTMGVKEIHLINSYKVDKSYWQTPVLQEPQLSEQIHLALEQSKDTVPPEIFMHKRFKPFVEDVFPGLIQNTRALIAHPAAAEPCPYNIAEETVLIIGPEGGFTDYEVEMFIRHGASPVTIGPHILRVEFAVPAVIGRLF